MLFHDRARVILDYDDTKKELAKRLKRILGLDGYWMGESQRPSKKGMSLMKFGRMPVFSKQHEECVALIKREFPALYPHIYTKPKKLTIKDEIILSNGDNTKFVIGRFSFLIARKRHVLDGNRVNWMA